MRIVIDMQGAQIENQFRGVGCYALSFVLAIARNRGEHEVLLALNGLFADTIEPIRAVFNGILSQENIRVWYAPSPVKDIDQENNTQREVAELIREAFLASLEPDVIYFSSIADSYLDNLATNFFEFDKKILISAGLYEIDPKASREGCPDFSFFCDACSIKKNELIKRVDIFFAFSLHAHKNIIDISGVEVKQEKFINLSLAPGLDFVPGKINKNSSSGPLKLFGIKDSFVLCVVGSDMYTSLLCLVEAWSTLPDDLRRKYQFLFMGEIAENDIFKLKQVANQCGLKENELLFSGCASNTELAQLFNLCELCIFPDFKTSPILLVIEAMACGAPIIGANAEGIPAIINLDEVLFDQFDVNDVGCRLLEVLSNKESQDKLREHGLREAKKFSWDVSAEYAIRIWKSECDKKSTVCQKKSHKPKMAFISPLPPERTGIADYSADLLPALAKYYDIELVVSQNYVDNSWVNGNGKIRNIDWLMENVDQIDRFVYQIGNSHFHAYMLDLIDKIPGVVVLHDFYLSGLMSWLELVAGHPHAWSKSLYLSHGYKALQERMKDIGWAQNKFPVNWGVLQKARGVIVHSAYAKKMLADWYFVNKNANWKIIPLLRSDMTNADSLDFRKKLKIPEKSFVVCSFGFLGPNKQNLRLLQSWLKSCLSKDTQCFLIFVGENPKGDYGGEVVSTIKNSGCEDRVRITGFVPTDVFHQYLSVCDLAVQLRTDSRGETSAAVLDCMNYSVPVIVNANGSMAELDAESVWLLPDSFTDEQLIFALEELRYDEKKRKYMGKTGKEVILDKHTPQKCAEAYYDAIEGFYKNSFFSMPSLIKSIANKIYLDPQVDETVFHLSSALTSTFPLPRPAKSIYLDITATCINDLKTGIERVARALSLALLSNPPAGYHVEPVYLCNKDGYWYYCYARSYTLGLLGLSQDVLSDEPVDPKNGDLLIGLDISGDRLVNAVNSGLHKKYRALGCRVFYMVHDLLPLQMPEVFPPGANEGFEVWLNAAVQGDGAICVSRSVADDLAQWIENKKERSKNHSRSFCIHWSHHGADISNSASSTGFPVDSEFVLNAIRSRLSFLMVGTIEPRKGHLQVVKAFDKLWKEGADINLVIVGHEGWKGLPENMRRNIPQTLEYIRTHPNNGSNLFLLEGISDEYLEKVYDSSVCLIAASYGEGFGLPLIESAQRKLSIIARDIPVFREVSGEYAYYFSGHAPENLASKILDWQDLYKQGKHPKSDGMPWLTWAQSAEQLKKVLGLL